MAETITLAFMFAAVAIAAHKALSDYHRNVRIERRLRQVRWMQRRNWELPRRDETKAANAAFPPGHPLRGGWHAFPKGDPREGMLTHAWPERPDQTLLRGKGK